MEGARAPAADELFLLTREWRDLEDGTRLVFWGLGSSGPVRVVITREEPTFFVDRDAEIRAGRRERSALLTMRGQPIDVIKLGTQRELVAERDRLRALGMPPYEADVKPSERFLMERFVTGAMRVRGGRV